MTRLRIRDVAQIAAELAAGESPRWLVRGLWPHGVHGIAASPPKVGKSWLADDLAVSVATGSDFLEHFPVDVLGPVLLLAGEDSERSVTRRLDAIVRRRGGSVADLAEVRICAMPVSLASTSDVQEIRGELAERPPVLTILDPLYVSATGAKGGDLYQMGEVLRILQDLASEVGSSLFVTHHVRKGSDADSGIDAVWGAGPGAWGRVVGIGSVDARTTEPTGASVVTVAWSFAGAEIPDLSFKARRKVWSEDPADLGSLLHYEVSVTEDHEAAPPPSDELGWPERRVLAALTEAAGGALSVTSIGDACANDGSKYALKAETIKAALRTLSDRGLAVGEGGRYRATQGQTRLEEAGT